MDDFSVDGRVLVLLADDVPALCFATAMTRPELGDTLCRLAEVQFPAAGRGVSRLYIDHGDVILSAESRAGYVELRGPMPSTLVLQSAFASLQDRGSLLIVFAYACSEGALDQPVLQLLHPSANHLVLTSVIIDGRLVCGCSGFSYSSPLAALDHSGTWCLTRDAPRPQRRF